MDRDDGAQVELNWRLIAANVSYGVVKYGLRIFPSGAIEI